MHINLEVCPNKSLAVKGSMHVLKIEWLVIFYNYELLIEVSKKNYASMKK